MSSAQFAVRVPQPWKHCAAQEIVEIFGEKETHDTIRRDVVQNVQLQACTLWLTFHGNGVHQLFLEDFMVFPVAIVHFHGT